jgi:hypothetical protein
MQYTLLHLFCFEQFSGLHRLNQHIDINKVFPVSGVQYFNRPASSDTVDFPNDGCSPLPALCPFVHNFTSCSQIGPGVNRSRHGARLCFSVGGSRSRMRDPLFFLFLRDESRKQNVCNSERYVLMPVLDYPVRILTRYSGEEVMNASGIDQ